MTQTAKTVASNCAASRLANNACRFREPQDTLSVLASRLSLELDHLTGAEEDLAAFGGSDCMGLVASAVEHRVERVLRAFGYLTLDAALEDLEARTSAKFVYAFGFAHLGSSL